MAIIGTVRLLDVRYTIEDDGDGGSMCVYSGRLHGRAA